MNRHFRQTVWWVNLIALALCAGRGFGAQPLEAGWWRHLEPEDILTKAQQITQSIPFYQGKTQPLSDDPHGSFVFIQRCLPDGTVESKAVESHGLSASAEYRLRSGHYVYIVGKLIKFAYPDNVEPGLAKSFANPYHYDRLRPATVGTNDCLVVARTDKPAFLQTVLTNLYPGGVPQAIGLLGDPVQYVPCEKDVYIRKSDGVIVGCLRRNRFGTVLENRLYTQVTLNDGTPASAFDLPDAAIEVASNTSQMFQIVKVGIQHGGQNQTLLTRREVLRIRVLIFGIMFASAAALIYFAAKRRFSPGRPEPAGGTNTHKPS